MAAKIGLVLTGGGARAAYQAGVLRGISEIGVGGDQPFPIVVGISAGTINAAFLACSTGDFQSSTEHLWDVWKNLKSEKIFRLNHFHLVSFAFRAILNLLIGGHAKALWPEALLDNSPLLEFLEKELDMGALEERIHKKQLFGLAFSATNFSTGSVVSFLDGSSAIKPWVRSDRIGILAHLTAKHVVASSAIPGIFKLVEIEGSFYGDGSTRVTLPLSPAIHLGAEKILAIDMRSGPLVNQDNPKLARTYPGFGEIFGVLLEAIFSDSLDRDLERLNIISKLAEVDPNNSAGWRPVPTMVIRPSKDLGPMAIDTYDSLSPQLRRILKVMGASREESSNLLSHLAFETVYTEQLLELGRQDALARRQEILAFFSA